VECINSRPRISIFFIKDIMNLSTTEKEILENIIYADIFQWPLFKNELRGNINKLLEKKIIGTKNGYYFLSGKEYLVERRLEGEKWAGEKMAIARKAANFLKIIPTILLVGVSGGLAVGNVSQNDDIDFFIVCQNGSLWTSRFLATVLLDIFGLRRKPADKFYKDKICLNMFVDEIGMEELKKQKDLFTKHELVQLKPMFERAISINLSFMERFFKFIQLKIMAKRRTSEKIEPHRLMFHPQDRRKLVIKKYEKKLLAIAKAL